jgi:hypothetical protein
VSLASSPLSSDDVGADIGGRQLPSVVNKREKLQKARSVTGCSPVFARKLTLALSEAAGDRAFGCEAARSRYWRPAN